jgi:hypothetical protein
MEAVLEDLAARHPWSPAEARSAWASFEERALPLLGSSTSRTIEIDVAARAG